MAIDYLHSEYAAGTIFYRPGRGAAPTPCKSRTPQRARLPKNAVSFMDKAKGVADQHDEQAGSGLNKAGEQIDEHTDIKYFFQIDSTSI